jgi:elongator complex protein 1
MVKFDEERPHDVQVAVEESNSTEVRKYLFAWDVSTVSPDGTAASIDGCLLNFTPFKHANVPPPMYFATITLDAPVLSVSSAPFCAGNMMRGIAWIARLSDESICLLGNRNQLEPILEETSNVDKPQRFVTPTVLAKVELDDAQSMRQFLVLGSHLNEGGDDVVVRCIAIACAPVGEASSSQESEHIVEFAVTLNGSVSSAKIIGSIPAGGRILRVANWSDTDEHFGALIELNDGSILEYEPSLDRASTGTLLPSDAEPMLEPCPWIAGLHSATASGARESTEKRIVVGMSRRSRLYFGERILSDACSSFLLSPTHRFLSYATLGSRSQLRNIPLSALAEYDPLMGSEENLVALGEGYEPRNLERGSRIVAILPEAPTAVLQLPRGNLEGIYPRALVLPFAMHLIDQEKYGQAMEIMRRQKIDLNLFFDMDPLRFLETDGVAKFVTEVGKIDYLNLFISCLFDGDITEWKYRVPSWFHGSTAIDDKEGGLHQKNFDFTTKVNQVCSKMREVMIQFESDGKTLSGGVVSDDHFLLPILSTFAKQKPPKLEEALSMIRENAIAKSSGRSNKSPLLGDRAQSSIQYLAFLADYPLLFDTALGMYDFDLARAVARNSQMDPKVYLPLLKRLRSLPESSAKYEVDVRLERFESALTHLASFPIDDPEKEEHFARCLSFIEQHKLHRLGLELYESDNIGKNKVLESLAERLLSEGQGQAALSIFCTVEPTNVEGAKRAAQACGDWKSFFSLLDESMAEDTEESKQSQRIYYADDIAAEIAAGKDTNLGQREAYACGARILLDYGQDIIGATDMLIKAQMWSEGRRVARLNGRNDLVKKCIDAATSYGQNCIEDFERRSTEFAETSVSYQKCLVLRKDANRREAAGGEEDVVPNDSESMFSLASNMSNTSLQSNMSGSSVSTVGSVTSVSSVITAQQTTSFTIVSDEDINKHKSKFNRIGGGKKKKRKKPPKRSRKRILPGSVKELEGLVGQLKFNCIDDAYLEIIVDTISFLLQVGKQSLAHSIFEAYNELMDNISKSQQERKESTQKEIEESRMEALREGRNYEPVTVECEAEIDALACKELPASIQQTFSFI